MFDAANPFVWLAIFRNDLKVGNTLANVNLTLVGVDDARKFFTGALAFSRFSLLPIIAVTKSQLFGVAL